MSKDLATPHSRAPQRKPRAAPWLLALVTASLVILPLAGAQGVSQEAALDYRDSELARLEARAANAEGVVSSPSGFGYSASVTPRVSVTQRLGDDSDATWSNSIGARAAVTYRYNGVSLAREVRDLERARFDLDNAQRDGVFQALRAHVTWWNQTRALATAATRLEGATADLAVGEEAFERGDVDRDRLTELRLAFDRADLAYREASYRYDDARNSAASYGLRGTPVYAAIRFALPEPEVDHLFAVRSLQVALDEAEAARLQAELFRVPKEVRLTGSYASENLVVGTEMGMFDRTPGANVTLSYPGATNPNWTIGLRAEFVIDQNTVPAIESAGERVDDARQALTDFLASYPGQLANARQLAAFAEENLTYAERALDLDERRLRDLSARLDQARASLEEAVEDESAADLERDIAALERDVERAITNLDRSEGALLSSWNGYIAQVNAYLRLVQGGWELR